jgi:hypothetical protein
VLLIEGAQTKNKHKHTHKPHSIIINSFLRKICKSVVAGVVFSRVQRERQRERERRDLKSFSVMREREREREREEKKFKFKVSL